MFRKYFMVLTMLLALPAFANAWSVNAKVSQTATGTITPAGNTSYTAGSTATFTTAAAPGYVLARVTIDGVTVGGATPDVSGSYAVTNPANKSWRYVVAYFKAAPASTVSIIPAITTTPAVTNGAGGVVRDDNFEPLSNIALGSVRKILVLPNPGYALTALTVNGVAKTFAATGATLDFSNLQANTTIAATFTKNVVVTVDAGKNVATTGVGAANAATLFASATANNALPQSLTFTWSQVGGAGELQFGTPTGNPSAGTIDNGVSTPAGTISTTVYAATAGTYTARLTVNGVTDDVVVTVNNADQIAIDVCASCHRLSTPLVFEGFSTSSYIQDAGLTCQSCHSGQPHGVITCSDCHNQGNHNFGITGPSVANASAETFNACSQCHAAATAGAHNAALTETSCIACHDVAIKHGGPSVAGNNDGVRAITTEFDKWSHHVTGVELNDAHCAACHLEGKVVAGAIVVDGSKHMADGRTHLRNADTDADYAWDPAAPDHTLMDNFCMSCHDSNGATSTASAQIQAFINANGLAAANKVASPSNPFGDTISNRYDKMQRPAVVDAKGQFDLSNPSHHAVMGQKYTKRTRVINANDPRAMTAAEVAAFTANSSATLVGKRSTIYDARAIKTSAGTGHNAPYNVRKFVEAYRTLSPVPGTNDASLGDDSVLHCGDCHTVGQWKANAAYNADGTLAPAAIGAHGSNNEYMLRNNRGTDAKHVGQTYTSASGVATFTDTTQPWLVCFNCHSYQAYGSIGGATGANGTNHAGEYANGNRCNGPINTIAFTGYTTSINAEHEPYAFRLGLGHRDGIVTGTTSTTDTDFSNLFGIQCANCHNAGPNNGFGGIHGAKIHTYQDANGAAQKAYRFLPGLGNSMYVPGSATGVGTVSDLNWEVYAVSTKYDAGKTQVIDNSGCYTIVPETGPGGTNADYALSPAFEQTAYDGTTHIFGTWGGCDDHRGNAHGKAFSKNGVPAGDYSGGTVATGGAAVTRKVLRPVTY